jgi:hypothetical protein
MSDKMTPIDIAALNMYRNSRNIKYKPEMDIVKKEGWDLEMTWLPIIGRGYYWYDKMPSVGFETSTYLPHMRYGSFEN